MQKKYIVRLSDEERGGLSVVVRKFKGTSPKVRRVQILLQADTDGPGGADRRIAEASGCRTKTGENVRQHMVERRFKLTLHGVKRATSPTRKLLDVQPVAEEGDSTRRKTQVIPTRLGGHRLPGMPTGIRVY